MGQATEPIRILHVDDEADFVATAADLLGREGDLVLDPSPVALDDLAADCWRADVTGGASLAVETGAVVLADEARLRRLLENLFRNAVEHGGRDVTVTVDANEDGFSVEDDGRGIPAGDREKVLRTGYSSRDDGTGFGLRIADQIAADHGWSLTVNTGRDGGARFEIHGVEFG